MLSSAWQAFRVHATGTSLLVTPDPQLEGYPWILHFIQYFEHAIGLGALEGGSAVLYVHSVSGSLHMWQHVVDRQLGKPI